jgi:mannose-1-phosphate guanylyltransferase
MPEADGRPGTARVARPVWAVVLAGGDGLRLAPITAGPDGQPVPKQFCALDGQESLLRTTLARAGRLVPPERVLVVVAAAHERWWRAELSDLPVDSILVQPSNRGTATGLLYALLHLLEIEPEAALLVLPSDHWVEDEQALETVLRAAISASELQHGSPVLVGFRPTGNDCSLGWIVPGYGEEAVRLVASFVEKPPPRTAAALLEIGSLWNSFMLAADARVLVECCREALPYLVRSFEEAWPRIGRNVDARKRQEAMAELFARLPSADFSRDVLEQCIGSLSVLTASSCGWTDVGTPERLAGLRQLRGAVAERARAYVRRQDRSVA